jgi:phosphoglycolate phosphatase
MSWPRAILFDLDGTLIDSAPDLASAVNAVLHRDRLGPLSVDAVRAMIGHGIRKLVERAYAACDRQLDSDELDNHEASMMAVYALHLTVDTKLLDGVVAALEACKNHDVALGVVTNKPTGMSRSILTHFGLLDDFQSVVGGDEGIPRKPHPAPLLRALEMLGVEPADSVMVGDSAADIDAARAAGIASILIEGGYSGAATESLGATKVIAHLSDLEATLDTWG